MMKQQDNEPATRAGVTRRTIVKGAAWSLPVVAVAVAAPMAAASGETVSGPSPTPSGVCSPVGNFTITVARNGQPVGGASVTVTLPAGFSWPDNTTAPKTFVAAGDGTVTITGVTGPSAPGTYNVVASVAGGGSANIPIMIQGTWVGSSSGYPTGGVHPIYTNPANVNNLGSPDCVAYCIENKIDSISRQAVYPGAASTFLGSNLFATGGGYTNSHLSPAQSATFSAAQVQAKVEWILKHSLPMVSLTDIETATGQTGLLPGDVYEATQFAVWTYTDMGYVTDWSFADGSPNVPGQPNTETPRYLQGLAVFNYLVNGAWNATATAPSSCLKVLSAPKTQCEPPTSGSHSQSFAMVCNCA